MTVLMLASAGAAQARTATALGLPACGTAVSTTVFHDGGIPLLDWRENLAFDGRGSMWVSHNVRGQVEGYTPDGVLRTTLNVPSPGGIQLGPDGRMYVNYGLLPNPQGAGIMRFDPGEAQPTPVPVVSGLSGINGLAIDDDGNFYLGRELSPTVLKLRPDGTEDTAWTAAARVFGTNGVTIADGQLYASVLLDLQSSVHDPAR